MHAEEAVVFMSERFELCVEVFVVEIRDRLPEVMADVVRAIAIVPEKGGEKRRQIVAAAFLEFGEEVIRPVFAGDFEAVAEDRLRGIVTTGFDFRLADFRDEFLDDRGAEVVDDIAFGAEGGAFDLHAGAAGDEEDDFAAGEIGGKLGGVVADGDGLEGRDVGGCAAAASSSSPPTASETRRSSEGSDHSAAGAELWECDGSFTRLCCNGLGFNTSGAFRRAEHRTAVRPAAAEGEVHAEAEFFGFSGGEVDQVEKFGRHEFDVFGGGVANAIDREGICRLKFDAAEAARFDGGEFACDAVLGDGGSEQPEADHRASAHRRLREGLLEFIDGGGGGGGGGGERGESEERCEGWHFFEHEMGPLSREGCVVVLRAKIREYVRSFGLGEFSRAFIQGFPSVTPGY